MTNYFKLRCFEPQTTKKIIVAANIVILILGAVHWGYCAIMARFVSLYYEMYIKTSSPSSNVRFLETYNQYKALLDSPIAFYAVTGVQQVLTSLLIILVACSCVGTTSTHKWVRILTGLILFNFAFNFVVATQSSMTATYYNILFKDFFQMINSLTSGLFSDWIINIVVMVKYVQAEAVLTFLVSLPLIGLTAVALAQNSFRQNFEIQIQAPTKIANNHNATLQTINH